MPPTARSRFAWFALLCAAVAALAVIHKAQAASGKCFVQVLDSDTLACNDGRMIRLIGVAPPLRDIPDGAGTDPVNDPGKVYLEKMIGAQAVRIKSVAAPKDARGRISAYVYLGEVLVNGRMIRDGYALADPGHSYSEHELFEAYESEARMRGLGVWKNVRGSQAARSWSGESLRP